MNRHIISSSTIATSILLASLSAQATDFSLGVGASWTDAPYKGYGSVYYPLPHIDFDNDVFFIDNFTVGAYIYNEDNQEISIGLSYLPLQFRPKDTNDQQLKKLNKRHSTILAEATYSILTKMGNFSTSIAGDILNESNSILINANYSYGFTGDRWAIIQTVGLNWANNKHNDYYYGITHNESTRSGLAYHNAKSSLTPYASLIGTYAITQNLATYLGGRVDKLTGDAKDSPMIENSIIPTVFAGLSYSF